MRFIPLQETASMFKMFSKLAFLEFCLLCACICVHMRKQGLWRKKTQRHISILPLKG